MKLGSGEWVTPTIQLLRQVDEGAMGSVWVADHVALGAEVAVKFVAERYVNNPKALRRLKAEARACAQLKSPHIVKIFDYGMFQGDLPYFVMEFLDGESLRDRFERDAELSFREVATLVTHVARGLHSAHRLGIVHRDIKPANLFLLEEDDTFFVKILDFGVAKGLTKGVTEPGLLLGTPLYMSRESIVENHIDHHADLWALSVVAYEALTNAMPFDGESIDEVCTSIWRGKFQPPSTLNRDLTPEVDAWFASAFHRDRQERPPEAKQLASSFVRMIASIRGALDGEGDPLDWHMSQLDLLPYLPPSDAAPASDAPPISQPPVSDPAASIKPLVYTPPPPSSSPSANITLPDGIDPPRFDSESGSPPPDEASSVPPPSPRPATTSGLALPPAPRPRRYTLALSVAAAATAAAAALLFVSFGESTGAPPAGLPHHDDTSSAHANHADTDHPVAAASSASAAPAASMSASSAARSETSTSAPRPPSPTRNQRSEKPKRKWQQPKPKKPSAPEKDLGF